MGTPPELPRRRFAQVAGVAVVAGLAGCAGGGGGGGGETTTTTTTADTTETTETTTTTTTTTSGGQAYLRAAHLSPDAPAVDVYVDGDGAFGDVSFGDVSDYAELPAGEHDVRITAAGDQSTVVFDQTLTLNEGFYTAVAYGELQAAETTTEGTTTEGTTTTTESLNGEDTAFAVTLLEDEMSAPADDEAEVRLFHASPGAPAVDVTVSDGETVLFNGVAYGEASQYTTVPPGSYTLEVRPDTEDASGDVVATFDVTVEGGTRYSAFAAGYLSKDPAFTLIPVVDAQTGGGGGMTSTTAGTTTTSS